jgi:GT2 family glycosyltransferase
MGIRGRLRDWGEIAWSYLLHGDIFRKLLLAIRHFDANGVGGADIFSHDSIKEAKASDLEWDGARAVWVVTGRDPRLVIPGPFPAGFVRVRLTGEVLRLRPGVALEAESEIFINFGRGFSPRHISSYRVESGKLSIDEILPLRRNAVALRIDPINTQCDLKIDNLRVEPAPLAYVAWRMSQAFRAQGGDPTRFNTAFTSRGEVRSAFLKMSRAVDRGRDPYQAWIEATTVGQERRDKLAAQIAAMPHRPKISVVMRTFRSDKKYLERAIASVVAQIYAQWELCIIDDGSRDGDLIAFLEKQAEREPRIKFHASSVCCGVAGATNMALDTSTGIFVTFLDPADELAPHALLRLVEAILSQTSVDMIYSDEDKIDADGRRHDPLFKPDWSPETMLGCMYTRNLSAYRKALIDEVGGLRSEFELSGDYDLALRIGRRARKVFHIPDVLYHRRTLPSSAVEPPDPTAENTARSAVQDHLDTCQMKAAALPGPIAGSHRIKLEVLGEPLVSIVIPTAAKRLAPSEQRWHVLDLLKSIQSTSTYRNYEIVLVENGDIEDALKLQLAEFSIVYVRYDHSLFNYSEKVNLGVAAAKGEFVILLNDDMAIITPEWIEELVAWLQRPGVVAVGPKLLFENRNIQHAGVLMLGQGPSHVYYGASEDTLGQLGGAVLLRNYSAVTAACLAVRTEDYQAISGFDPAFRVNYNDADFCLRLRERGRILYTPEAKLFHLESVSRDDSPPAELEMINQKWGAVIGFDPHYNRNLSQYTPYRVVPQSV